MYLTVLFYINCVTYFYIIENVICNNKVCNMIILNIKKALYLIVEKYDNLNKSEAKQIMSDK